MSYVPEIEDLPEELLEYVFMHLSPYGEMQACRSVSRQWRRLANGALDRLRTLFLRCSNFEWALLQPPDVADAYHPAIAERCSHAACYHEDTSSVFVFGGCTMAYTTFNDLWRFDLKTRTWVRSLPGGAYPTPKACATMMDYNGLLVLFGGWSKSSPNPIHQTAMFFNELHFYNPVKNYWDQVVDPTNSAPHLAGHSATIIGDNMVIFGGSHGSGSSNTIWVYSFVEGAWHTPIINSNKPLPRYGQSQIKIDDSHILVVGGCGGPNLMFSDVWLLTIDWTEGRAWCWHEIRVENASLSPPQIWSHPGCHVGSKLVILSKSLDNKAYPTRFLRGLVGRTTSSGAASSEDLMRPPRCPAIPKPGISVSSSPSQSHHQSRRPWDQSSNGSSSLGPPPRRRLLITSKSLDEEAPPPSPKLGANRSQGELQRAQSIPAIIVGEIPKLVVTEDNSAGIGDVAAATSSAPDPSVGHQVAQQLEFEDQIDRAASSGGLGPQQQQQAASSKCIAMAASSLLPNQAIQIEPPSGVVGPNVEIASTSQQASPSQPSTTSNSAISGSSSTSNRLGRTSPYPSIKPNAMKNRAKQLEVLRKMEEYIARSRSATEGSASRTGSSESSSREGSQSPSGSLRFRPSSPPPKSARPTQFRPSRNPMNIYRLDVSRVLIDHVVSWSVDVFSSYEAPEDTILYSLVKGRGELILFGGMRSAGTGSGQGNLDVTPWNQTITNETYIIRPELSLS